MNRPIIAMDLFCGGGGAAEGLLEAGFDRVIGIDIEDHSRNYPGEFILGDATCPPVHLDMVDFVWASPPCQFASIASGPANRATKPNLIPAIRELLAGHPFACIENVPPAIQLGPLRPDLVLTGPMCGLHRIWRKRVFELTWFGWRRPYIKLDRSWDAVANRVIVCKNGPPTASLKRRLTAGMPKMLNTQAVRMEVMGIKHHMTRTEIAEAVPPAYARLIGVEVLSLISEVTR